MRSNALTSGFPDAFFEDLARFAVLPEKAIADSVRLLHQATETSGTVDEADLLPLAKSYDVTVNDLSRGTLAALHLLEQARDQRDKIDAILDDLVALGRVLDPAALKRRLRLFDDNLQERLLNFRREQEAIAYAFPVMSHFHASAAMAFTLEKKGLDRRRESVSSYRPEIRTAVPVTILQFDVDRFGEDSSFSFACSINDLSDLINHLEFARKEALAVRTYVRTPKKESSE